MALDERAVPAAARDLLREAMANHEKGDVGRALDRAREALRMAPAFTAARSYLGSTLVTRRQRFAEGLAELEQACRDAPGDAALWYTLGWCSEFAAHAAARRRRRGLDPDGLYRQAAAALRRCLELNPDGKLLDDAKDLLASILKEDVD